MSLNMYLGEVRTQSQSMNAFCVATIQGMEQAINLIDAFIGDAVLQGQTYDSAKTFFAQTFRPLAQGIIYLCEELIRQNDAFPNDFQSQVASTDVIEQEILGQIREIERTKTGIEVISQTLPGMQVMVQIFDAMKRKLQEKLEHLHEFNYTSSSNYDTALQLAASIAQGLAEVQSGKGFNATAGTFSIQELNMGWTASIQKIAEDKAREADNLAFMSSSAKFVKPFEGGYKTFVGSAEWKTDGRLGGKAEGNLIEGKYAISKGNEFSFKAGHGEVDLNAPYNFNTIKEDFFTGNIIGGKVGITGLENSISTNIIYNTEMQVTQKFLDGSLAYGIEDYTFKDDAELTIQKYELALKKIDIPDFIPFIGEYDIEIRGEFGIGTFGYKLHAGRETGLYVGGGKVGGGIFAKFTKPGEE
ncbi:hypothetical protein CN326_02315 [Bacillus sp. AFS018417]|uniref:T7SS effector LXG polymorphic toxin n=1 Tax=Bacillus sp. AFS018417 TaxID=2033491 RepID=UPI000BF2F8E1|nr:T7SS effector LXG polymorphic toxin [Bacillus sp. AFS018417]PEZ09198.1 hypothetical protein CN326_02315 [Bacillus sp. AFS018417]